ncbi:MAG: glycosyltransferase family A protein [Bacilli bacterium]|nr:glycosyltransferase family A protein [Bacilli bacterium]
MTFSIIIPNYNCGKYIKECIDSIFNQTFKDYEVIVIDDGSTDNSIEVIKNYNVKILHTKRKYAGGARNKGIEEATGEYIIFLDSDDWLYDNQVLERLNNKITDEELIFLGFYNEKYQRALYSKKNTKEERIEKDKWIGCPSKCWKREFIKWKFPEKMFLEDVYFVLKGYCEVEKWAELDGLFFYYRNRLDSTQNSKEKEDYREISKQHIKKLIEEYPQYKIQLEKRL